MKLSLTASTSRLSEIAGDLKSCENEPLQFIGQIQSFGALIAFTVPDQRVQTASVNIEDVLGQKHATVLGAKLGHLVGEQNAQMILGYCRELGIGSSRISFLLELAGVKFDTTVYTTDGLHFVEFEPAAADSNDLQFRFTQENEIKACLVEMRKSSKVQAQAHSVCRAVQKITGMDRVMMYQFIAPHMHGEVIAEHRTLQAHSFMNHRFPASDIPRIARDLYLRNGLRFIPETNAPTFDVRPALNPTTGQQLDLSDSRLRAVSPIHLEYLRNMKVRCSFSIAVVIEGRLWGLIACHHIKPLSISVSQRTACEVIANAFAGMAGSVEQSERLNRRIHFDRKLRATIDGLLGARDPVDQLMKLNQSLLNAFDATGAVLIKADRCDLVGLCPPRTQVLELRDQILKRMAARRIDLLAIDSLSEEMSELEIPPALGAGVIAMSINPDTQFLIFRPELVDKIVWGGDPRKQLEKKGFEGRINPRSSFETWEETVRGVALPWADFEKEGFRYLMSTVFDKLAPSRI